MGGTYTRGLVERRHPWVFDVCSAGEKRWAWMGEILDPRDTTAEILEGAIRGTLSLSRMRRVGHMVYIL